MYIRDESTKIDSVVWYSCKEGYILSGPASRKCTVENNTLLWIPGEPSCVKEGIFV